MVEGGGARIEFDADRLAAEFQSDGEGGTGADKGIDDRAAAGRTGQDTWLDQLLGKGRRMVALEASSCDRPDRPFVAAEPMKEPAAIQGLGMPARVADMLA